MPKSTRSALLLFATLALACAGGEESGDPDGALGAEGAPAGTAPDGRDDDRRDADSREADSREAVRPEPMDTGAWVAEPPADGAAPSPHPWVADRSTGGRAAQGAATLLTVRSARQDGFDRVVFEFDSHVPQWRIEYVDSPQHECGSGEAVRLEGDGWLEVHFEMANAHTEEGRPTDAPRHVADPAGTNLRELRRTCDFEAQVTYVLGLDSPNRYRAFELSSPARLVVDVSSD